MPVENLGIGLNATAYPGREFTVELGTLGETWGRIEQAAAKLGQIGPRDCRFTGENSVRLQGSMKATWA